MNRVIEVDRWDLPELAYALAEVPVFADQRRALEAGLGVWAADGLDDIFFLLFKARPTVLDRRDVDAAHVLAHVLVSLLALNPTVQRLRRSTMRDLVGAATAAAALAPQFAQAAQEAAVDATDLEAAESEAEARPDEPWLNEVVERRRDEFAAEIEDRAETALEGLETAAEVAANSEERLARAAETWGLGTGELRQLPVAERLALAAQLDTERAHQVTDLFGRLESALFLERAEMDGVGIEPTDVELGGDLSRMLGSELLALDLGDLFFARVGDGALAQYATQGLDVAGKGGIVLCVDGSYSMAAAHQGYTRELWASALKIFLLRVALRKGRPMHVIDFGGPGEVIHHRFVDPGERTPARLLDAAGTWFGYGTDFSGPLRKAVQVLADESDRDSDIVFVSDGECTVPERTRQTFLRAAKSRRLRTWGVQLGPSPGALPQFCDHVLTITDLTSGRELGELLNAVESPRA